MEYSGNQTAKGIPAQTIVRDWNDENVRIIIMRGPGAFCVYLGVPEDHPLAGHNYDDLPVDCHGGLTFGSKGDGAWPEGFYWYGFDYAHAGDKVHFSSYRYLGSLTESDIDWTIADVEKDIWSAIWSFKRLIRLSENIAKNK